MSRVKDEITLWVRRGIPKTPEMALVGKWIQYRIKEIVAHYRLLLDDARIAEYTRNYPHVRIEKIVLKEGGLSDAAGPGQYRISGSCKELGSEKLWKALMSDIGEMLNTAKPFMEGGSMSTKCSTKARPEWFTWENDFGILVNTSKPISLHYVGKSCQLGNNVEPIVTYPVQGKVSIYYDTRVEAVWAIGEACAAGRLASKARRAFTEDHKSLTNDAIFANLTDQMDNKAILLVKCITANATDPEWMIVHPKPWQLSDEDIYGPLHRYTEQMNKWLDSKDPFEHEASVRGSLCPLAVLNVLRTQLSGNRGYTQKEVRETLEHVL